MPATHLQEAQKPRQTGHHQEALCGPPRDTNGVSGHCLPSSLPGPHACGSGVPVPSHVRHKTPEPIRGPPENQSPWGGLVPSPVGAGAGASAQASHPPSRSGWLAEAVILLGSAGRSPGKTAALSGVPPGRGRQHEAPLWEAPRM